MSEYQEICAEIQKETDKNAALKSQIQQRTEDMLTRFWKINPMLKSVDKVELTQDSLSAWVKSHLTGQG